MYYALSAARVTYTGYVYSACRYFTSQEEYGRYDGAHENDCKLGATLPPPANVKQFMVPAKRSDDGFRL